MGIRLLVIPRTRLADFFRVCGTVLMEGLPKDAEIVACSSDVGFMTDEIVFQVRSAEWPEQLEGSTLDRVQIEMTEADPHLTYQDLFFAHHEGRGLSDEQIKARWAADGHSYKRMVVVELSYDGRAVETFMGLPMAEAAQVIAKHLEMKDQYVRDNMSGANRIDDKALTVVPTGVCGMVDGTFVPPPWTDRNPFYKEHK